jgi:hypothetical protein
MDHVGAIVTIALTASALYRTISGKREALTAGLWAAALAMGIAGMLPLGRSLKAIAELNNLAEMTCFGAFVISSYLIARMTYRVARIESPWLLAFTVTSITGMIALYYGTELHHASQAQAESSPGAASTWFAIVAAIGLLPTHIAAIIGTVRTGHKDNLMVWLLGTYGGVGAVYPLLIVANHIGTGAIRWSPSFFYPFVWVVLLISFGALSVAGAIGAYRAKQDSRVSGELSPSGELRG